MISDNIKSKTQYISAFALIMITVGAVDSIRNLPATALFGSNIIAFYLLAAVFFFIALRFSISRAIS